MRISEFRELMAELVTLGHEMQGVECKSPGPRGDRLLQVKVIKAMLGMANRRDGGYIIIGIRDKGTSLISEGLSLPDLSTWEKYDDLASSVAEYADPSISFELETHDLDGKNFVLVTVKEFEDVPILLCKKDYSGDLRKGGCYVRSRHKPETTEIPTQEDMRNLLDLAAEKRIRKFVVQARSVGLGIPADGQVSDKDLFDKELGDFYRG